MTRAMKDSGVAWIGEIPEGWGILRLKSLFSFGKGLPITKDNLEETGIPVISYGQIHSKTNSGVRLQDELFRFVNPSYIETNPESLVHSGDIIVADTSEDTDGCGNCSHVDRDMQLFAGYHTIILKANSSDDNKYIAYLMKTDPWRSQIRSKVSGVKVFSISRKILADTMLICPPIAEQSRIAAFLDRRCAEIDSVIAATQRTIEEYKKLKQSIITEAVTHGVREPRKMKDSGVEWIGEIPEEWRTAKLKTAITGLESGVSVNAAQYPAEADKIGVLKTSCVSRFRFIPTENKAVNDDEIHRVACPVRANTLIMSRMNTPDLVGACGYSEHDHPLLFLPDRLWQISFVDSANVKFFWYYLNCSNIRSYYGSLAVGTSSSMQNISQDQLFNTVAVFPSSEEQKEIVVFLDVRCAEIDSLIEAKQRLLSELESYKKSVIYEYVTGKKETGYQ